MKKVFSILSKVLRGGIKVLLSAILEVVFPLLILSLPIQIFMLLSRVLFAHPVYVLLTFAFYTIFIPTVAALIIRAKVVKKRRLDLYFVSLLGPLLISLVFWFPSLAIEVVFCISFYVFTKAMKPALTRLLFPILFLISAILLLLSGFTPVGKDLSAFVFTVTLPAMIGFIAYALIVGDERFAARPRIALTLGIMCLSFGTVTIYINGGRTGWLTRFIIGQPSVELIYPATPAFSGPRAVVPIKDGLLIYSGGDKLLTLKNNVLSECIGNVRLGRVDLPICDPDDKAICYVPTAFRGITIVDTSNCTAKQVLFFPARYDLIAADPTKSYYAIVENEGRYIGLARRVAPGKLEKIGGWKLTNLPKWKWSRFVDIYDDRMVVIVRTLASVLQGYSYDIKNKTWTKFFESRSRVTDMEGWHGVTIKGKRVVFTNILGEVYIFDWNGRLLYRKLLFPFIRQVLYDPNRMLCYLVDDIGFVTILDPFEGKILRMIFCGFKTKNIHHEGDYIFIGSTSGLFKIDIDKAIGKGERK